MSYGCSGGTCGHLKCIQNSTSLPEVLWTDCNGSLADGCEIDLASDEANCVTCGVACEPGQTCSTMMQHYPPAVGCACPGGQTICHGPIEGVANCVSIANDPLNCGAAASPATPMRPATTGCVPSPVRRGRRTAMAITPTG